MKKLLLVAVIAVAGLSSCKKDYDCTYTYDLLGVETTVTTQCLKCSKADVESIEASGYVCE